MRGPIRLLLMIGGVLSVAAGHALSVSPILVSCASSHQDVVRAIARLYEADHLGHRVLVNAGASNLLARQIEEGAPVDLFISADRRNIDRLVHSRWIDADRVVTVAGNTVVIVAPSDRARPLAGIDALAGMTAARVALPDTTVPLGWYATILLREAGIVDALGDRLIRTENARATLAAAISGAVDFAFVYATDAATTDRVRVVHSPSSDSIPIRSYAALIRRPGSFEEAARFLRFLTSPAAREAFRAAGFLPVEDGRE